MSTDTNSDYSRTLRIGYTAEIDEAVKSLKAANRNLNLSETQLINHLVARGARATLTDLALGGELQFDAGKASNERCGSTSK